MVVKGTDADDEDNTYVAGSDFLNEVENTFGEVPVVLPGELQNTRQSRRQVGIDLYNRVSRHSFKDGEPLNIVAHSHGGNAVKEYTKLDGARRIDVLVGLGTPHRSDHTMNPDMVQRYINVWSSGDIVVPNAGGEDGPTWRIDLYDHAEYVTPHAENIGAHQVRVGTGDATSYEAVRHSRGGGLPGPSGPYGLNGPTTWRQHVAPLFPR